MIICMIFIHDLFFVFKKYIETIYQFYYYLISIFRFVNTNHYQHHLISESDKIENKFIYFINILE